MAAWLDQMSLKARLAVGVLGPVLLLGSCAGLAGATMVAAVGASSTDTTTASPGTCGADTSGDGHLATLTGEQSTNARTIVSVTLGVVGAHLGAAPAQRAAVIAIATAMQESTLRNLAYGDRDSVGLFQQRIPWGSFTDRTTPAVATTMFLTGGHGGQPGLRDITGWQAMPIWQAAQSVQVSGFPAAYAKWEGMARGVVAALAGTVVPVDTTTCPSGGTVSAGGWAVPLPSGAYTMVSGFGQRLHPISGTWRMHSGQDMAAPTGTPVSAAAGGRVTFAGISGSLTSGFGRLVVIDHGGGVATYYGHLSSIGVAAGQAVTAGQMIGAVGSTGGSTGPHLHFQIQRGATPFDPVPWLKDRGVLL